MYIKKLLADFAIVFSVTLVVVVIVTLIWNLVFHGSITIDWESSFRLAIYFGTILPWIVSRSKKK